MKSTQKWLYLALSLTGCLSLTPAFADGTTSTEFRGEHRSRTFHRDRRDVNQSRRAFRIGVCVGEALAAQGVSLPTDRSTETDEATKTAVKAAITQCKTSLSSGQRGDDASGSDGARTDGTQGAEPATSS